jgi:hypothetical protein
MFLNGGNEATVDESGCFASAKTENGQKKLPPLVHSFHASKGRTACVVYKLVLKLQSS